MKEIKVYEAFDGTRFDTESMCKHYEEKHFVPDDIKKAILRLAELCAKTNYCHNCPLYDERGESHCWLENHTPAYWKERFEKS